MDNLSSLKECQQAIPETVLEALTKAKATPQYKEACRIVAKNKAKLKEEPEVAK